MKTHEFIEQMFADPTDECVIWPFSFINKGYAKFTRDGKTLLVHRVMCERVNGPPPTDKHHAAHSCGRGKQGCVNPFHTEWKTPQQNEEDKLAHGTHNRGRKRRFLKLTNQEQDRLIKMYNEGMTCVALGYTFGINRNTVKRIVERARRSC